MGQLSAGVLFGSKEGGHEIYRLHIHFDLDQANSEGPVETFSRQLVLAVLGSFQGKNAIGATRLFQSLDNFEVGSDTNTEEVAKFTNVPKKMEAGIAPIKENDAFGGSPAVSRCSQARVCSPRL